MGKRKTEKLKQEFIPECKPSASTTSWLNNLRRRRDSMRKMIEHANNELADLKSDESRLTARIAEIELQIKKGEI